MVITLLPFQDIIDFSSILFSKNIKQNKSFISSSSGTFSRFLVNSLMNIWLAPNYSSLKPIKTLQEKMVLVAKKIVVVYNIFVVSNNFCCHQVVSKALSLNILVTRSIILSLMWISLLTKLGCHKT